MNERRKKKFSEWLRVNFAVLWAILWNWCILFVLKISVCIKLEWVGYLLSCLWWKQICLDVIVAVQFIWRQISFPLSHRSMLSLWVDVLCVVMRITFCIRHTLNLFWLSFSSCYMNWKLCLSFMAWRSIITTYMYTKFISYSLIPNELYRIMHTQIRLYIYMNLIFFFSSHSLFSI